jgi:hypothetical protein
MVIQEIFEAISRICCVPFCAANDMKFKEHRALAANTRICKMRLIAAKSGEKCISRKLT